MAAEEQSDFDFEVQLPSPVASEGDEYGINSSNHLLYDSVDDERDHSVKIIGDRISAQTGSSWYASVFIVVNAGLGAGLLNFPAAFNTSGGIAVAVTIQAVLMVFIVGALLILAYCSDANQNATYQDVVFSMCGKHAQTLCSITVILYSFGCCITFFIIIGDQLDKFLTFVYGSDFCHYWYMNRKFTIVSTSLVLVLPICFPRRIDFLKYASFVGFIGILYCVLLVTVKYFVGDNDPGPIRTKPQSWSDVFTVVPVICFAYQCHISCVPVYACLKKRTQGEFVKTVMVALAICIFAYTGTASFGYLTFGSDVNDDILSSYDPTPDVLIAVILIAAKMYTTYPILLFVGRAALDSIWISWRGLSPDDVMLYERSRRITMTIVWFVLSLGLAVIVPNISAVIDVLGGLAAIFIFTFPGMCLLQVLLQGYVDKGRAPTKYYLLYSMAVGYLIIGAFIFGLVTTQSLWNDITIGQPSQVICH